MWFSGAKRELQKQNCDSGQDPPLMDDAATLQPVACRADRELYFGSLDFRFRYPV